MEDKTILEELLERSPDTAQHKRKMDKAYHLLSQGALADADALFDEILREEPFNHDALTGKKLIERHAAVEKRLDSLNDRIRRALPETEAEPEPEAPAVAEPVEEVSPAPNRPGLFSLLRSRKVLMAVDVTFAIVCAASAFIVMI